MYALLNGSRAAAMGIEETIVDYYRRNRPKRFLQIREIIETGLPLLATVASSLHRCAPALLFV
jgi:hypothetical protein